MFEQRCDHCPGNSPGECRRATAAASAAPSTAASAGPSLPTELGSTQGQTINVLSWPGYVENGSTDKAVDWVTDFQTESGCTVNAQIFGTSDEAYTLFTTNPEQFDIVSASGDASLRLVRGGFVQPVNLALPRATRTSSRRSRTSRTTPSMVSPTASRTAAARTC